MVSRDFLRSARVRLTRKGPSECVWTRDCHRHFDARRRFEPGQLSTPSGRRHPLGSCRFQPRIELFDYSGLLSYARQ